MQYKSIFYKISSENLKYYILENQKLHFRFSGIVYIDLLHKGFCHFTDQK